MNTEARQNAIAVGMRFLPTFDKPYAYFHVLSARVANVLARAGISTFTELAGMSDAELLALRGLGRGGLAAIRRVFPCQ